MIRKIYTSMSTLHFSVGGTRIAFTPLTSRLSYYETTDEAMQAKLEAHPWYGDKFRLRKVEKDKEETEESKKDSAPAPAAHEVRVQKSFSTLADAKEWLAKEHGAVRSNIRTIADAVVFGKSAGIDVTVGIKKTGDNKPADTAADADEKKAEDSQEGEDAD